MKQPKEKHCHSFPFIHFRLHVNKTFQSSLSFTFIVTCLSHMAKWLHSNHQWCSLSDNGFLFQKSMTVMFHDTVSKLQHTIYLLLILKNIFFRRVHISNISFTCPTETFLHSFYCSQYRSKIFTQVLFNFFYIGLMHLSRNIVIV